MYNSIEENIQNLLVTGKYSPLFYKQFVDLVKSGKLEFDFIAREIEYLEGTRLETTTKKESMFRGEILKGLWHKHIFDAHNIAINVKNSLSRNWDNISKSTKDDKEFLKKILKLIPKSVANPKKTGDWIVYEKTDKGNHYLTFATHNEDDENVYRRIQPYLAK